MSTTAAIVEDVDTDLLDAALTAGPKAERVLAAVKDLVGLLKAGTLTSTDRFELGGELLADLEHLTGLARTVFDGATR